MLLNSPALQSSAQTLYLLRHGETDLNAQGIVQGGGVDAPLNERGHWQAERFFAAYRSVSFGLLVCSALQRTAQTLAPFATLGIPQVVHPGLNEMGWGVLEGVRADASVRQLYHQMSARWESGELDASLEGGESPREVAQRAQAALHEVLLEQPNETLLICAHGRLLRILLTVLLGYDLRHMHRFGHSNTGLNILRRNGLLFAAERLNDTSHLD